MKSVSSALSRLLVAIPLLAATASVAHASVVAIVDSGVDYKHPRLADRMWNNPGEIADNGLDDDGDTFIDDVYGWNLAESNNQVIDYSYLGKFSPDCTRFFEIQRRVLLGQATDADKAWAKSKTADPKFLKQLQTFGNFVHGTHVAGISAGENPDVRIMALKLLPTEIKLPFGGQDDELFRPTPAPNLGDFFKDLALKKLLSELAKAQGTIFAGVGSYVNGQKAQVANLSLGTSTQAAAAIVTPLLKLLGGGRTEPTAEEIRKYSVIFVNAMVTETAKMAKTSPETLFVMAAGNDGSNNDLLPVAPANMREPNSITVAATLADKSLAVFSNYGEKMVDVAAPGVGILSSIPGGESMYLSGTSQAAPYVAMAAGAVLDENASLSSSELREVLMGTVDAKDFLAGKVRSGGIVNRARAVSAARFMAEGKSLAEAVKLARVAVADTRHESLSTFRYEKFAAQFALPLPSTVRVAPAQ